MITTDSIVAIPVIQHHVKMFTKLKSLRHFNLNYLTPTCKNVEHYHPGETRTGNSESKTP